MSLAQRRAALETANRNRLALARVRRDLHTGTLTLEEVLLDPPECVDNLLLWELLLLGRRFGRGSLLRVNRLAIREGRNLCVTVGGAAEGTRRWLAGVVG